MKRNLMTGNIKRVVLSGLSLLFASMPCAAQFSLQAGKPATVVMDTSEREVVRTALTLLQRDYRAVFSDSLSLVQADKPSSPLRVGAEKLLVGTVGQSAVLKPYEQELPALKKQGFLLRVLPDGRLLVAGADAHGTAYGLMELSRLWGVSPWEWWADVTSRKQAAFTLPAGYEAQQSPSVEYRGIFINDEDWGLVPWARFTYEPGGEYGLGKVGPRTTERIFELLLRLRANLYWPPMHECTEPFFLTAGNREVAARYGIHIGGSHCEPMGCSAAVEWGRRGVGAYDYVNNSEQVYRFWENRVKEVAKQEMVYTVGMRGVHDGKMQGATTVEEQKAVIDRVFKDQRSLLRQYVAPDVTQVPQVFIPYKEVLDIYNAGLEVPEDVTLMWCDDNYGYIRHFPTAAERARKGGNGIYYHISYWGRPHDYLWLGTVSPYLLFQQMHYAYERGIQKMWILNVGDIKPSEYQTELFLDMAWNIDKVATEGVTTHLKRYLARELNEPLAEKLLPVMQEHYRLAFIRKPEFLGNTRTEESAKQRIVRDMPWSKEYIKQRLAQYDALYAQVEGLEAPADRKDAFFQLVQYPVQAAALMNRKMLGAQLARHGEADWTVVDEATDGIASLTRAYNIGIENQGKWMRMMDCKPRRLPVFDPLPHTRTDSPMAEETSQPALLLNATECAKGEVSACEGLGYAGMAALLPVNKPVSYDCPAVQADSVTVELTFLPTHPVDGKQLRVAVSMDKQKARTISYETHGRSEEWKQNVLRNAAIRRITLPVKRAGKHTLHITALDEGCVLDQVKFF